jgi:hypothetical protein
VRKVRSHLKRREKDLAVNAYADLQATGRNRSLTARDLLALAPALAEAGHAGEARTMYEEVIDSSDNAAIGLRASMALADLHLADGQAQRAVASLEAALPRADALPEWKTHLERKIEAAKTLLPVAVRPA